MKLKVLNLYDSNVSTAQEPVATGVKELKTWPSYDPSVYNVVIYARLNKNMSNHTSLFLHGVKLLLNIYPLPGVTVQ